MKGIDMITENLIETTYDENGETILSDAEIQEILTSNNIKVYFNDKEYTNMFCKTVLYTKELLKRFPKLTANYYFDEIMVSGKKDGYFPCLKIDVKFRGGKGTYRAVTVDGVKRSYAKFDDFMKNMERDIKYLLVKKGKYSLEDLQ